MTKSFLTMPTIMIAPAKLEMFSVRLAARRAPNAGEDRHR
jgi:hypothetical protein